MKFGLHNPSFQPVSGGPASIFPELREKAQWLEANGFDYMSVMDHLNQIPGVGGAEEPFMEAWVTLGALANATTKLYLTTMVSSVSYRNPALLAKMVTTLDLISGGRAILLYAPAPDSSPRTNEAVEHDTARRPRSCLRAGRSLAASAPD